MPTLKQYFDQDAKSPDGHSFVSTYRVNDIRSGSPVEIKLVLPYDLRANATYIYAYVPHCETPVAAIEDLMLAAEVRTGRFPGMERWGFKLPYAMNADRVWSDEVAFTRRLFVYAAADFSHAEYDLIYGMSKSASLKLQLRDNAYAKRRAEGERPMAFISHDWRDKRAFVEPLAYDLLDIQGQSVWYDQFVLKPGDSLYDKISEGLGISHMCVLVLSPRFLENERWAKTELRAAVALAASQSKPIVPILLDISTQEVAAKAPLLADRVSIDASIGVNEVSRRLTDVFLALKRGGASDQ